MHWMARAAKKAGLSGADALALRPEQDVSEVWATAAEVCRTTPADLASAVASAFRVSVADLGTAVPTAAKLLPGSIARKFGVFPLKDEDHYLVVATSDPANPLAEQEIGFASGRTPRMVIAPPESIAEAIEKAYSADIAAASVLSRVATTLGDIPDVEFEMGDVEAPEEISEAETSAGPIVRLTNMVFQEAVARGASDIHIQPVAGTGVVRFRTDGVLHTGMDMPLQVLTRVISRIKIISKLDIADRLRPQDGRARISVGGRKYDLRISTVPTRQAEKAVIRILDTQGTGTLQDTRIASAEVDSIRNALKTRDGIFVVTGPTGSGKTTTLYGALREISTDDVNIMTVEDPVEYELPGLTQIQVEPKQDVTFASALRAILRQDPDVIFVGEIRDPETAAMAAQASLTGHLVLASLHTNDALGAIRRFVDLGLDVGTVCETLRGALAQRLVRQVCAKCVGPATEPLTTTEKELQTRYGIPPTVRRKGCPRCVGQGYLGRLPVTEFLRSTQGLVRLILGGAPVHELQEQAKKDGMRTLLESALGRVLAGETTLEEVERVVGTPGAMVVEREPPSRERRDHTASTLHAASVSADDHAPLGGEPDAHAGAAPHVLVVDDDKTSRLRARMVLEREGFTVSESADGSEALARIARGESFSLMVLDLDMPMLGGREVLRAVRASESASGLPVVVLTGSVDPDADIEMMEQGADDYIRKPIDPPRFLARIRAALRRSKG